MPATSDDTAVADSEISVPLMISWVTMVAFVSFLATQSHFLTENNSATLTREYVLHESINQSANACTDPYNYTCGNYGLVHGHSAWDDAFAISLRLTKQTDVYKLCEDLPDWFWVDDTDDSSGAQNDLGDCNLTCRIALISRGAVVNDIEAQVGAENGTYTLYIWHKDWTETNTCASNECDCLADLGPNVRSSGPVCAHLLEQNMSVQNSKSIPKTCVEHIQMHNMAQLADELRLGDATQQRIKNVANALLNKSGLTSRPSIYIGGGAGLVDDYALPINLLGSALEMYQRRRASEWQLIGQPADPSRWTTSATVVNAFYDRGVNAVYLPAGITRRPFFDPKWADDLLIGGIGFILAHEIGHALDCERNDSSFAHTIGHHMAQRAGVRYAEVENTEHESVADAYGIVMLETAFTFKYLTGLQLAQLWCLSGAAFTGDVHAPGRWRVDAALTASQGWKSSVC